MHWLKWAGKNSKKNIVFWLTRFQLCFNLLSPHKLKPPLVTLFQLELDYSDLCLFSVLSLTVSHCNMTSIYFCQFCELKNFGNMDIIFLSREVCMKSIINGSKFFHEDKQQRISYSPMNKTNSVCIDESSSNWLQVNETLLHFIHLHWSFLGSASSKLLSFSEDELDQWYHLVFLNGVSECCWRSLTSRMLYNLFSIKYYFKTPILRFKK